MLIPLNSLSRLIVSGKDRARFLHNFCTNHVNDLQSGKSCEAFFCDVKARVIAHGYVLAFDDCHEIWTLGGNQSAFLKHLDRYIITEDVQIVSVTDSTSAFVAIGAASFPKLMAAGEIFAAPPGDPLRCARSASDTVENSAVLSNASTALCLEWADTPMLWIAFRECPAGLVPLQAVSEATEQFERMRILARFPVIGRDMSIENLAPEAERNASAISYVKGCYLGQEPIARLDAMGHVNRALKCVESPATADQISGATVFVEDNSPVGMITSAASAPQGSVGLTILRTNAVSIPLHTMVDGNLVPVKVVS